MAQKKGSAERAKAKDLKSLTATATGRTKGGMSGRRAEETIFIPPLSAGKLLGKR
jgi:hypothetical protein